MTKNIFKALGFALTLAFMPAVSAQIHLSPIVHQLESGQVSHYSRSLLTKMNKAINDTGLARSYEHARFVLAANVIVNDKVVMSTAPTQVVYNVDLSFVVGDGITGTKFATETFRAKGVGSTEDRALLNAINNAQLSGLKGLVEQARGRIISYYDQNLRNILARAKSLAGQEDYEGAMRELGAVPEECRGYAEVQKELVRVYDQYSQAHSAKLLMEAEAMWATDPSLRTAGYIQALLADINPSTPAYKGAKELLRRIEQRYERIEQRQHEQELSRVKAIKEIMLAQAKNQPKTVYHVRGWW